MRKIKILDGINISSVLLTIIGFVLELVGCRMSTPTDVGVNFNLNPMVYVGVAIIAVGLTTGVYGYEIQEKKELNKVLANVSLYLGEALLVIGLVLIILTMLNPVLHPTNG